jgi:FkbM family methyltransferase
MIKKLLLTPLVILFKNALTLLRASAVYVGNGKIMATTITGSRLYLFGDDISVAPHIISRGFYEIEVTRFLSRYIKPNMVIVEIGANIGYHTVYMGTCLKNKGYMYIFEAMPRTFELLQDNIHINGLRNVAVCENKAVYDKSGEVSFSYLKKQHGSSGVIDKQKIEELYKDSSETFTLPCISLDEYIKEKAIGHVDFVKIDAEGAESKILQGMKKVLSQDSCTLLIEIAQELLEKAGHSTKEMLSFIEKYGFTPYEITKNGSLQKTTYTQVFENKQYRDIVLKK